MASYWPESHKTLITLLRQDRSAQNLSLRKVVARLPEWMNFQYSTLAKIERGTRDVSYAELREIVLVLGTTVAEPAARVEEIVSARYRVTRESHRKKYDSSYKGLGGQECQQQTK